MELLLVVIFYDKIKIILRVIKFKANINRNRERSGDVTDEEYLRSQ